MNLAKVWMIRIIRISSGEYEAKSPSPAVWLEDGASLIY
jgi:hypothetical protein